MIGFGVRFSAWSGLTAERVTGSGHGGGGLQRLGGVRLVPRSPLS